MLFITIKPIVAIRKNIKVEGCESFTFNGILFTADTIFQDTSRSQLGCDSIITEYNVIISKGNIAIQTPKAVCKFNIQPYSIATNRNATYLWDFGNGFKSSDPSPNFAYSDTGKFNITCRVTFDNGCINRDTIEVYVHPSPTVYAGLDTTLWQGISYPMMATSDSSSYNFSWSPPAYLSNTSILNPIVTPLTTLSYVVTAVNYWGCSATDTVKITVKPSPILPNSFSPNGDGIHDKWVISNLNNFSSVDVKVFNRSGQPVYEKKNYDNSWDGKFNGTDLPVGTYYYLITVNHEQTLSGWLYLIR